MALFNVHRGVERDLPVLERLCAEAGAPHAGLLGARRDRLTPAAWLGMRVPLVVVSDGTVPVGFAVALADHIPLGAARCVEALAYVAPSQRRRGAGRAVMSELLAVARTSNLWKLIAYTLPEDPAARALLERVDFRQVGTLVKHLQLEGGWHDVALHERLVLAARKSLPSINDG